MAAPAPASEGDRVGLSATECAGDSDPVLEQDPSGKNLSAEADSASRLLAGPQRDGSKGCRGEEAADKARPAAPSAKVTDHDLQEAALRGDVAHVKQLIFSGTSVNAPIRCNEDGDTFATLLHVLSSRPDIHQCTQVLHELLRKRANLNARSSAGSTPLSRACLHKHVDAAELLLVAGADVAPRDDKGRDAITCSAILKSETNTTGDVAAQSPADLEELSAQIVVLLAKKGADLDQAGQAKAPLLEAINCNNHQGAVALMENGAKPRFLHEAVEEAPIDIIQHLLKFEANPFEEDKDGQTVLDIAFKRGDDDIATLLRDHIGDLERARGRPSPPLLREKNHPAPNIERTKSRKSSGTAMTEDDDGGGLGLSSSRVKQALPGSERSDKDKPKSRLSLRHMGSNILSRAAIRPKTIAEDRPAVKRMKEKCGWLQQAAFKLNNNRWFQALMCTALVVALFFPDLWILMDMENNDDLDVILVFVLILFLVELGVQMVGMPRLYIGSFFFWMDIVGALSVPLDLSIVNEALPQNFDNAVVMRAARTARLGARAGRFTKLVKLLRFLPGVNTQAITGSQGAAKTMSNALMHSLSTRVSCLIIVMVMVLPLFDLATYPENDFSMKTWMNALDYTLEKYPPDITSRIEELKKFYDNKDYFPFELSMSASNGTTFNKLLSAESPRRKRNEVVIKADSGSVTSIFNFASVNRVDSLCNIVLIITIIGLMMAFSLLLSNSVSAIVLRPLENLLAGVKQMASKIFKSVTSMTKKVGAEDDEPSKKHDDLFGDETQLLEKVIDKLATLSAITMKTSPVDAETLEQLGENERAVLQGFQQHARPIASKKEKKEGDEEDASEEEAAAGDLVASLENCLEEAGIGWATLDSWHFNVLAIEEQQRQLVCLCFLIFNLGLGYDDSQQQTLAGFTAAAASGYLNPKTVPYHNWFHAVDVTHCIFRLLNLCSAERFLSGFERYALIISAICHDIGHPGVNNPFLVETSHELAIRYNDHSPLENMHCAKLFEIVGQPKTAVFAQYAKAEYRDARQVCIEAILHTDNTHHFSMLKELQMLYEMNSDVFDIALQMNQASKIDFPPKEVIDIFSEPDKKKLIRNLFLHFCDVSNPTKPFDICRQWAWHILDEFFLQGDKEKELGIAVQPLNDRDKVNRPYSQVGFIEFFVAPFAFATVRLLPPLIGSTDQMISNLNSWCEEWVNEVKPEEEELVKLQDRITKLEAKYTFRDVGF